MRARRCIFLSVAFLLLGIASYSQQSPDPDFNARVVRPAYTKNHPKILFDEAHNNFHTSSGRYKAFADLMTNDGYIITPNKAKFQRKMLEGHDVLVIANPLGAERQNMPEASRSAFTEEECDAVRDWVRSGGSLLLIADHEPFGAATSIMSLRFGIEMSKGHTIDRANYDLETGNMSFLIFTRANKLILEHPITRGRDETERINRVITFTGQSLKGPVGSAPLLRLSETAVDLNRQAGNETGGARPSVFQRDGRSLYTDAGTLPRTGEVVGSAKAAVRSQALAFDFGKGRVVVLGEAAMISAQIVRGQAAQMMGKEEIQMGMNRKGFDNRQLALNIMHWLSRLLS